MDNDEFKQRPAGIDQGMRQFRTALEHALESKDAMQDVKMKLVLTGGLPEDRFPLTMVIDGAGTMTMEPPPGAEPEQSAKGKKKKDEAGVVQRDFDARPLLKGLVRMDDDTLLLAENRKPIPPDSLIGRLTVEAGGYANETVFMADPEQARTAGHTVPPALEQVIDRFYSLGAEALGRKSLKP